MLFLKNLSIKVSFKPFKIFRSNIFQKFKIFVTVKKCCIVCKHFCIKVYAKSHIIDKNEKKKRPKNTSLRNQIDRHEWRFDRLRSTRKIISFLNSFLESTKSKAFLKSINRNIFINWLFLFIFISEIS